MSPGPDTMILSALERHNLPALFAALPLLRDLDSEVLAEITREVEWFSVPGGATLFEAGQPADGLYVVVNGTLGLFAPQAGGGSRPSGRVAAGETVGEAEVISGTNRTVTVVALRNCEVARLPVATFEKLVVRNPGSLRQIANVVIKRLDSLLLLARSDGEPRAWHGLEAHLDAGSAGRSIELVLIGRPQSLATARRWLDLHQVRRHHHVRNADDLARVVRLLTGRALAVVLSGGGARGFAHIGVLRALQAAMLPVDAIGATSIGAIIGAGWAAGWGYAEVLERMRRSFVGRNPIGDYTLPLMSLVSGGRVCRLLRAEFGALHIEDLPLPFFCTSANLTNGQAAVHRRGTLWLWLRAAVSIPGVLPPVFTERQVHVDGATINNLPVDIMRESMEGAIVAVDAGADRMLDTSTEMSEVPPAWRPWSWLRRDRPRVNIVQILLRCGMINSAAATIAQRALADLVLKPPLDRIDLLDWQAFDRVVELGYRHASETLAQGAAETLRRTVGAGVQAATDRGSSR